MRKFIIIVLAVISIFLLSNNTKAEELVIPDSAIRLRVIPNSNNSFDIHMKEEVKSYLEKNVYSMFNDTDNIKAARLKINEEIPNIEIKIKEIFDNNLYNMPFNVKYGMNYFPEKKYKGITYDEGYYESLVVEIGDAKGDNWWCVLFPTLCLLDSEESTDVEYKLGVLELLK